MNIIKQQSLLSQYDSMRIQEDLYGTIQLYPSFVPSKPFVPYTGSSASSRSSSSSYRVDPISTIEVEKAYQEMVESRERELEREKRNRLNFLIGRANEIITYHHDFVKSDRMISIMTGLRGWLSQKNGIFSYSYHRLFPAKWGRPFYLGRNEVEEIASKYRRLGWDVSISGRSEFVGYKISFCRNANLETLLEFEKEPGLGPNLESGGKALGPSV